MTSPELKKHLAELHDELAALGDKRDNFQGLVFAHVRAILATPIAEPNLVVQHEPVKIPDVGGRVRSRG